MLTHTRDKLYECQSCQKKFRRKNSLHSHAYTQHGKCPSAAEIYMCGVCGKRFTLKHNLKSHMSIHTGDKPYTCQICQQKFRRKQHLQNHASSIHGTVLKLTDIL